MLDTTLTPEQHARLTAAQVLGQLQTHRVKYLDCASEQCGWTVRVTWPSVERAVWCVDLLEVFAALDDDETHWRRLFDSRKERDCSSGPYVGDIPHAARVHMGYA